MAISDMLDKARGTIKGFGGVIKGFFTRDKDSEDSQRDTDENNDTTTSGDQVAVGNDSNSEGNQKNEDEKNPLGSGINGGDAVKVQEEVEKAEEEKKKGEEDKKEEKDKKATEDPSEAEEEEEEEEEDDDDEDEDEDEDEDDDEDEDEDDEDVDEDEEGEKDEEDDDNEENKEKKVDKKLTKTLNKIKKSFGQLDDSEESKQDKEKIEKRIRGLQINDAKDFIEVLDMLGEIATAGDAEYDELNSTQQALYDQLWDKLQDLVVENLSKYRPDIDDDFFMVIRKDSDPELFGLFREIFTDSVKDAAKRDDIDGEDLADALGDLEKKFINPESGGFNLLKNISLDQILSMAKDEDEKTHDKYERELNAKYRDSIGSLDKFHENYADFEKLKNKLYGAIDEMDCGDNKVAKVAIKNLKKNIEKTVEEHQQILSLYEPDSNKIEERKKESQNEPKDKNINADDEKVVQVLQGDGYSPMYIIELAEFLQECDDYAQSARLQIMPKKSDNTDEETRSVIDQLSKFAKLLDAENMRRISLNFIMGITDNKGRRFFAKSEDDSRYGRSSSADSGKTHQKCDYYVALKRTLLTVFSLNKLIVGQDIFGELLTLGDDPTKFFGKDDKAISDDAKKICNQYNTLASKNSISRPSGTKAVLFDATNDKIESLMKLFKKMEDNKKNELADEKELKKINDFSSYPKTDGLPFPVDENYFYNKIFGKEYNANNDLIKQAQEKTNP